MYAGKASLYNQRASISKIVKWGIKSVNKFGFVFFKESEGKCYMQLLFD